MVRIVADFLVSFRGVFSIFSLIIRENPRTILTQLHKLIMDLSHILNHLGEDREQYFGAVSPPVMQTSNFAFPNLDAFRQAFTSEYDHHPLYRIHRYG